MTRPGILLTAAAVCGVLLVSGCGSEPVTSGPSGVDGLEIPTPSADPDDFVEVIDNPWLPLVPGTEWVYAAATGEETVTVTVTDETREVDGVTTTVVHEVVTAPDGDVLEDRSDWYAQDTAGNVWAFGADDPEAGSWEAGVNGAQAGLAMPAVPRVGDGYEQEHLDGVAEDRATVLSLDESVNVVAGSYSDVLQIEVDSPLDPGATAHRYYARDVGLVYEESVAGGSVQRELTAVSAR